MFREQKDDLHKNKIVLPNNLKYFENKMLFEPFYLSGWLIMSHLILLYLEIQYVYVNYGAKLSSPFLESQSPVYFYLLF